ncbi:MAG: hypothetical protein HXY29_09190 [Rhodocyclaceae bacterium]|jgi:hypothetical protein|nr:hypothetical protein [Rhodocyclaceae bacterium]
MGNKKPAGVRLQAEAWRVLLDAVYEAAPAMVKARMLRANLEQCRKTLVNLQKSALARRQAILRNRLSPAATGLIAVP